ncbi:MAG: hypothetical protein BJ554DRAFT_6962, partial [Olpidium bornovanus]
ARASRSSSFSSRGRGSRSPEAGSGLGGGTGGCADRGGAPADHVVDDERWRPLFPRNLAVLGGRQRGGGRPAAAIVTARTAEPSLGLLLSLLRFLSGCEAAEAADAAPLAEPSRALAGGVSGTGGAI